MFTDDGESNDKLYRLGQILVDRAVVAVLSVKRSIHARILENRYALSTRSVS